MNKLLDDVKNKIDNRYLELIAEYNDTYNTNYTKDYFSNYAGFDPTGISIIFPKEISVEVFALSYSRKIEIVKIIKEYCNTFEAAKASAKELGIPFKWYLELYPLDI
jgi:hypothetical protein